MATVTNKGAIVVRMTLEERETVRLKATKEKLTLNQYCKKRLELNYKDEEGTEFGSDGKPVEKEGV